jgi:glycosyltransferase involved in cell wall biosynthesis
MSGSTGVIIAPDRFSSIVPSGKFFGRDGDKFFLKAVRLAAASRSPAFEHKIALLKHLAKLHSTHTTAAVIADDEAEHLADLAAESGLYALIELKLEAEYLFSRRRLRAAITKLRERVTALRGYRSAIGYLLDCPIDPASLRSHGLGIVRARLSKLVEAIRATDPSKLIGLKHRIGTVALTLREEDFVYGLMPSLSASELRATVIRLHNLAQARPVVLEFGPLGALQDEIVSLAFGLGAAGVVVQSSAALSPGPSDLLREGSFSFKLLRAFEVLPFLALNGSCPPKPAQTPKVSVVVCAYNAERTMRRCLESLRSLDYPNFEVIVVDDGSSDATAQIAAEFPEFRLIRQPNKGLSAARNVGLQAAVGELVAYTDSDCVVDPHWLSFTVRSMMEGGLDGCGGPNYGPHEEGWVEGCVAASPGAPSHVLIGDERAEHLAGCNMVFRKLALEEVGAFDPQFSAAGDDVDICWRLIDAGYVLGYCPSAFVWHFRRNTIKAYYGQQRGYGKAEAMLYFKYPERFNLFGQIKWKGTIPGFARTVPGGARLRVGWVRSVEQFQPVYEMPLTLLAIAPMTAEWSLVAATLLVVTSLCGVAIWPALVAVLAGPLWALHYALSAPLEKCHRRLASRLLIGWLAYSGSLARAIARYRWRAGAPKPGPSDCGSSQQPTIDWRSRSIRLSYWNGVYTTRQVVLENLRRFFRSVQRPVLTDSGWNDFDLLVNANPWTRIQFRTADEELGGLELKTNVAARLRLSNGARILLGACLMLAGGASLYGSSRAAIIFAILAVSAAIGAVTGLARAASLSYRAIEQCARALKLVPLGQPATPAGLATMLADPEPPDEMAQPASR